MVDSIVGGPSVVKDGVEEFADAGSGRLSRVRKYIWEDILRRNPKAHVEADGTVKESLTNITPDRENRKKINSAQEEVNRIGHAFSMMSPSALEDSIGTHSENQAFSLLKDGLSKIPFLFKERKKYNEYSAVQKSYEAAKKKLELALKESGQSDTEIAKELIKIDAKFFEIQFMNTAPEEVQAIQGIPDISIGQKILQVVRDPATYGYMVYGFGVRMATVGFLGFIAAPLTAALVGATREGSKEWDRSSAELRERDRNARSGNKDSSNEALNIVRAVKVVEIGAKNPDRGVIQKTRDLIEKFLSLGDNASESMIPERVKILDQLKARATYMEDKLKLNRIDFGSEDERASNIAKFFETLAEAKMILADNYNLPKSTVVERLEQYLSYRENAIHGRRRSFQVEALKQQKNKIAASALKAGAFSLAGASIAEYVRTTEAFEKVKELAGLGAVKSVEGVSGTQSGSTPSAPESAPVHQNQTPQDAPKADVSTEQVQRPSEVPVEAQPGITGEDQASRLYEKQMDTTRKSIDNLITENIKRSQDGFSTGESSQT